MVDVSYKKVLILIASALAIFDISFISNSYMGSFGWLQATIGLPIVLILPGLLALILMGAKAIRLKEALLCFATSLLSLMLVGLAANYIPEILGYTRPLNTHAIIIIFNLLISVLLVFAKFKKNAGPMQFPKPRLNRLDITLISLTAFIIITAILGSFRLNNGGSDIVSMVCLSLITLSIPATIIVHKRLNTAAMVAVIYGVALSILLMTSLRGWDVTGLGLPPEYTVYTLTTHLGKWDIGAYRDAYNACLSITILPVVLTRLLHVSGLVVFKFIFQALFAIVPVIIFELTRGYLKRSLAFLGAILFTTFPTFITDSAMLARQDIAYIFFAMAILVWFTDKEEWLRTKWKVLFLLMSIGVIFSHYSTTYTYVFMLLVIYFSTLFLKYKKINKLTLPIKDYAMPGLIVIIVSLGAFFWYAQTTNTSKGLAETLRSSLLNITNLLQEDGRSAASNYSLFSPGSKGTANLLTYLDQTKSSNNTQSGSSIDSNLNTLSDSVPISPFTQSLNKKAHLNIVAVTKLSRSVIARLFQILVVIGTVMLLIRGRKKSSLFEHVPVTYALLCISGILILAIEVVLPNISIDYGLLRAFQQNLIFFSTLIIGVLYLFFEKIKRGLGLPALTFYIALSSALFTGLIPQITGGLDAQLNLNNSGQYYGSYYVHAGDLKGFEWANANISHSSNLHASIFTTAKEHDLGYPFSEVGILPFQLSKDDYVLLQDYQVKDSKVYIDDNYEKILVALNQNYYKMNRSLIYNNTQDNIYGPQN